MKEFKEMDKVVRDFMDTIDEMLENDKDINANSISELEELIENYDRDEDR